MVLRLTPAFVGILCRKAATADGSIAPYSGRASDYEDRQTRRFAQACGTTCDFTSHGTCELSGESGGYRINVWEPGLFDHLITDADAAELIRKVAA